MKFSDLKLSKTMLSNLKGMGYETPSPVQAAVIPHAIKGQDIIAQANTGTGKTAAFSIPLIENINEGDDLQVIVLAPSRELASQIFTEIKKLSLNQNIKTIEIIGGVSYTKQLRDMKRKPNIIVATPGRLMDMLDRAKPDLTTVKVLVLDEADEMLNFGFYKDIKFIANKLPKDVQRFFLTATFNSKTKKLADELLNNPFEIKISEGLNTASNIEQLHVVVKEKQKLNALVTLLKVKKPRAVVIFGRTRRRVDELTDALKQLSFKVVGIQGDMKQSDRSRAVAKLKEQKINIIVGTDVIARGIDVSHVDLVINFDLPTEIEYYTHRVGRTGRANAKGKAISLVKESEMSYFQQVLKQTNSKSTKFNLPNENELADIKKQELNNEIKELITLSKTKFEKIGERLAKEFSKEELAIALAANLIGDKISVFNIKLTSEKSAEIRRAKSRSRSRSGRRVRISRSSESKTNSSRSNSRNSMNRTNFSFKKNTKPKAKKRRASKSDFKK